MHHPSYIKKSNHLPLRRPTAALNRRSRQRHAPLGYVERCWQPVAPRNLRSSHDHPAPPSGAIVGANKQTGGSESSETTLKYCFFSRTLCVRACDTDPAGAKSAGIRSFASERERVSVMLHITRRDASGLAQRVADTPGHILWWAPNERGTGTQGRVYNQSCVRSDFEGACLLRLHYGGGDGLSSAVTTTRYLHWLTVKLGGGRGYPGQSIQGRLSAYTVLHSEAKNAAKARRQKRLDTKLSS